MTIYFIALEGNGRYFGVACHCCIDVTNWRQI